MKLKILHILFAPVQLIIVFALLYKSQKGQSGGDLALILFSVIYLTLLTIGIGIYSFNWEFKNKLGLIFGLLLAYLLEYILIKCTL